MTTFDKPKTPREAIPIDPLPQAGDSLYDQLIEQVFGQVVYWAILSLCAVLFTAFEWYRYLFRIPITLPGVISLSILAALVLTITAYKIPRALRRSKSLKLGIRGEMHVGKYLDDQCRPLGYRVLHDIPCTSDTGGTDFNIDHVLIGPAGIFSIETKNWSKPPQGTPAKIWYVDTPDGGALKKYDGTLDAVPVIQARANATKVRKILAEETGRDWKSIHAHAVLLFPGWYTTGKSDDLWVLADNSLHQWLPWEPQRLSPQEINLFYNKLAAHQREKRKN